MPDRVRDRIVLITGASSGTGRAAAFAIAGEGAHLILVARNREKLGQLVSEIRDRTGNPRAELARLPPAGSHE